MSESRQPGQGPERDVDAEIAFHLEMRVQQNRARGLDEEGARIEAERRFGDVTRIREACLEEDARARRGHSLRRLGSGLRADLRLGVRQLRRSPAYAMVAILTLALAMAANAVIYGVTAPYFLRALPFAAPDRLLHLYHVDARTGSDRDRFSLEQLEDLRERTRAFSALAAYHYRSVNVTGEEGPERTTMGHLTANAFDVLGASPLLGRTFAAGEDAAGGGADVVMLGWGMWQRRYAGDPSILGRAIQVDGRARTVIGVMPRTFNFPFGAVKLWAPLSPAGSGEPRESAQHLVFGRLAEGWTAERAAAELRSLHATLAAEYPQIDGRATDIVAVEMREALNFAWPILRMAAAASAGAVAFVLLISCANIAGVGIARSEARSRELAVRGALGATRFRLVRQILVETLVIACIGGALGILLAHFGLSALGAVVPEELYRVGDFAVDGGVVAYVALVVIVAGIVAGIAPALLGSRSADLALREDGRTTAGRRAGRLRRSLVAAQVALGLVLIVCAGLMARSLERVRDLPLGFDPASVLTVEVVLPPASYPDAAAVRAFFERAITHVEQLPGVLAVGTQVSLPLDHETYSVAVSIEGAAVPEDERPLAQWFRISPGYIESMDIEHLEGRLFSGTDDHDAEGVALVSASFARDVLGGDAIGRRIIVDDGRPLRVVGVVGDIRHTGVADPFTPQLYTPTAQGPVRRQFLVIEAEADAAAAIPSVRTALASLDADLPLVTRTMDEVVGIALMQWSMLATVLTAFGAFALLLGAIGLYGLIAYSVQRRRREIGVRMALGARGADVTGMIVREGLRLAAIGVAAGLVLALAAGRVIAAALYGVEPDDPYTLGAAALLFLAVAAVASVVPARIVLRRDPLEALRAD